MVGVSLAQGHLYLGHLSQGQGVIDQEDGKYHSRQSNTGLGGPYVLKAPGRREVPDQKMPSLRVNGASIHHIRVCAAPIIQ